MQTHKGFDISKSCHLHLVSFNCYDNSLHVVITVGIYYNIFIIVRMKKGELDYM